MTFEKYVIKETNMTLGEIRKTYGTYSSEIISSLRFDYEEYLRQFNDTRCKHVHDTEALIFRIEWYEYEDANLDNWER